MWDAVSGQSIYTWTGHEGWVWACAWSPDGTHVVSAGADGTLRLWDTTTGQLLRITQIIGDDHAVYVPGDRASGGRIIEASEGAWRWLGWQVRDANGALDMLPAEAFGPLPPPTMLRGPAERETRGRAPIPRPG